MTDFEIDVPPFTDLLATSDSTDKALPSPDGDAAPPSSPLTSAPSHYGSYLLGGGFLALVMLVALVWIVFPGDREQLRRAKEEIDSLQRRNAALSEQVRVLEATERTQALQIETLEQDKEHLLRSMQEAHEALDGYRPAYDHLDKN